MWEALELREDPFEIALKLSTETKAFNKNLITSYWEMSNWLHSNFPNSVPRVLCDLQL